MDASPGKKEGPKYLFKVERGLERRRELRLNKQARQSSTTCAAKMAGEGEEVKPCLLDCWEVPCLSWGWNKGTQAVCWCLEEVCLLCGSPLRPCLRQVLLYVYDLSNGFAQLMSQSLLGKQVRLPRRFRPPVWVGHVLERSVLRAARPVAWQAHSRCEVCCCPASLAAQVYLNCALCSQLDGIWHTSVVVGGVETFFGNGIQRAVPGATPHGSPVQVITLGCAARPCAGWLPVFLHTRA